MATWSNTTIATLKVNEQDSITKTFTFVGVNSSNEAGSPDDFLAAANRLLGIVGKTAQLRGMKREITQEAIS